MLPEANVAVGLVGLFSSLGGELGYLINRSGADPFFTILSTALGSG